MEDSAPPSVYSTKYRFLGRSCSNGACFLQKESDGTSCEKKKQW